MLGDRDKLPDDGIYRAILWVMVLTVMAGAVFAILGETVLHDPVLVRVGAGVALVGGGVYAFFRWLGAREVRKGETGRRVSSGGHDRPDG